MSDSTDTTKLSGQFSWPDHKHVSRLIFPLRKRVVVHGVALLLVFLVISAFRPQPPIGPIAFAVVVAIYLLMLWRLQRRRFVKQQENGEKTHIEINDSGVTVRAVDQETRFAASVFETVTRDDRFIVLRGREPGGLPIVVLPKSWCLTESDWSSVERIVAKWLPPVTSVFTTEKARRFRLEHLPAEIALKRSVFLLLALSLVITLVAFVVPFHAANAKGAWFVFLFRVQTVLVTAVCCLLAWGVRRFAAWSRFPLQGLSFLCLPLFPIGTAMETEHTIIYSGLGDAIVRLSHQSPRDLSSVFEVMETGNFSMINGAFRAMAMLRLVASADEIPAIIRMAQDPDAEQQLQGTPKFKPGLRKWVAVASAGWPQNELVLEFLHDCEKYPVMGVDLAARDASAGKYGNWRPY